MKESIGDISHIRIQLVSYREDLPSWLTGCQRRAFDHPALRESIAQYLGLVRQMTNSDYKSEYMMELKELLLQEDNLVLAGQLSKAFVDTKVELVTGLYSVINRTLRDVIHDLPNLDPEWAHLREQQAIRRSITGSRQSESGLYYPIAEGAWLSVAAANRLWLGVSCAARDCPILHRRLKQSLAEVGPDHSTSVWYPWWRYPEEELDIRDSNEYSLRFLNSGEESHVRFAKDIANTIGSLWAVVKSQGLRGWG